MDVSFDSPVTGSPSAARPDSHKRRERDDDTPALGVGTTKVPSRTMLYLECADARQWEHAMADLGALVPLALLTRAPWPLNDGVRVVELSLVRTATLALVDGATEPPSSEALEAAGLDGWRASDSDRVVLVSARLLRVIDGDKRPGLSQVLITDMLTTMSLGAHGANA